MTSLVLMRVGSPDDHAAWDALLSTLRQAGATIEDASGQAMRPHAGDGSRVAFVAGSTGVRRTLSSIDHPSIRVFAEVDRGSTTSRQRSGWLRDVLRAVESPGGTPPGRARLGPLRHTTR